MRYIIYFTLILYLAWCANAAADPLIMVFNQRHPYHYIDGENPVPHGLVADIAVKILSDTGMEIHYKEMSANRIFAMIKQDSPFCSFGWFKTPERLQYAKFTYGLLQDEPFIIVTNRRNKELFDKHKTLASVFSDSSLKFGTRAKTSYGEEVDALIDGAVLQVIAPNNTQINMIKMLDRTRFHFMLLVPVEIEEAFSSAGVDLSKYTTITFPDIPKGNKRRIMCTKSTDDDIIQQINESIQKNLDPSIID